MTQNPTPFDRRLRLLIAREFASRGYYLDAESFFEGIGLAEFDSDELALLALCANKMQSEAVFGSRIERLEKLDPSLATQIRNSMAPNNSWAQRAASECLKRLASLLHRLIRSLS